MTSISLVIIIAITIAIIGILLYQNSYNTVLGITTTTIDRQLFVIEEQENRSIEVYDRSNSTQIAGFDNFTEMVKGMPRVIEDMQKYYADKNLTEITVVR
ncbi:MAG: hypothetical protein WA941_03380 [Nitrososphaeraceae archaeon]